MTLRAFGDDRQAVREEALALLKAAWVLCGLRILIQLCFQPWVSLTVVLLCRINHKYLRRLVNATLNMVLASRPPPFALKGQPSLLLFSFYFLFTLTPVRVEKIHVLLSFWWMQRTCKFLWALTFCFREPEALCSGPAQACPFNETLGPNTFIIKKVIMNLLQGCRKRVEG